MFKPLIGIATDVRAIGSGTTRDEVLSYLTYVDAVRRAGGIPLLVPPQPENVRLLMDHLHGLLLTGGYDCDPALYGEEKHPSVQVMDHRRQDNDFTLAEVARQKGVPTLGVCLGVEVMNVAAGGTLIQDILSSNPDALQHASPPENRDRHDVRIEADSQLFDIIGRQEINVNSSHHQAIGRQGEGLRLTAVAPDGIPEALEDPVHPFYLGVQWHPEDMAGEDSATRLFSRFIEAAGEFAGRRRALTTEQQESGEVRVPVSLPAGSGGAE